jgi:hypothetical protein
VAIPVTIQALLLPLLLLSPGLDLI